MKDCFQQTYIPDAGEHYDVYVLSSM